MNVDISTLFLNQYAISISIDLQALREVVKDEVSAFGQYLFICGHLKHCIGLCIKLKVGVYAMSAKMSRKRRRNAVKHSPLRT